MKPKNLIKGLILTAVAVMAMSVAAPQTHYRCAENQTVVANESGWTPQAFAAGENDTPLDFNSMMDTIAKAALWAQRIFYPLIHFFAFNIGNFLQADYIYSGPMGEMLQDIWVVNRNIVNVAFVLILLFLAVKEIFTSMGEGTDLKKTLGKFALILIAVNFTWLGSKVVIDAANVATNVAFSIPSGVASSSAVVCDSPSCKCDIGLVNGELKVMGMCLPTAMYAPVDATEVLHMTKDQCEKEKFNNQTLKKLYDDVEKNKQNKSSKLTTTADSALLNTYEEKTDGEYNLIGGKRVNFDAAKTVTYCWAPLDTSAYNANNAVVMLTYGMAKVQKLIPTSNKSLLNLTVGTLFSFIIMFAYMGALAALFFALIIRMAALWIFVSFSPFLVLLYFLGLIGAQAQIEEFDINAFIKWAFVPAKVGIIFSVAFLMIAAGQKATAADPQLLDSVNKMGNVTVRIIGTRSLYGEMEKVQELIWFIICTAILWIGTFSILSKMPVVNKVTDKINAAGRGVAGWAGSLPYKAAVIPVKDSTTGKMKLTSLETELKDFKGKYMSETDNAYIDSAKRIKGKGGEIKDKAEKGDYQAVINIMGPQLTLKTAADNPSRTQKLLEESGLTEQEAAFITNQIVNYSNKGVVFTQKWQKEATAAPAADANKKKKVEEGKTAIEKKGGEKKTP
ncbi:hypothetical protein JXA05_01835 [Candidatus Peregrinibacteria bacterium]|nr:hypothetical protein [Candidatus Peregrinibacteria bacterium]